MRFFYLSLALIAVTFAFDCYVGTNPNIPILTQCAKAEKCCYAGGHYLRGKYFACEALCPDFKRRDYVSTSSSEGFQKWCVNAEGACKYTH